MSNLRKNWKATFTRKYQDSEKFAEIRSKLKKKEKQKFSVPANTKRDFKFARESQINF